MKSLKISREAARIARGYSRKPKIIIFGSHSAIETDAAAKMFGFQTILIAEKGREKLYTVHCPWLFDEIIVLEKFSDLLNAEIQDHLIAENGIFIPNRSFTTYVPVELIKEKFRVPIFGSRQLFDIEEQRELQRRLLKKAGVMTPRVFKRPEKIDVLAMVKLHHARKKVERGFFRVSSTADYYAKADLLKKRGVITEEDLKHAEIQEYVIGAPFNSDAHVHALKDVFGNFSFVGFSDRIQSNRKGLLNLLAREQLEIDLIDTTIEVGHTGQTMRESLKIQAFEALANFIEACRKYYPPGMIGMCSLQGALTETNGEIFYVFFDISPRVAGDPIIGPTSPEMRVLSLKFAKFGIKIEDPLDLTMYEIWKAFELGRLEEAVT